jgi:hypothetical protein
MSGISTTARTPDSPSSVRPLPARPNLEFERKQAKKLLAQLQRGDPDALRRASKHSAGTGHPMPEFKLADAQFIIAREFGFRSWPRLIEYFTTLERHERSERQVTGSSVEELEDRARSILSDHRRRLGAVGSMLVAFVPRFFGFGIPEVFDSEVTIDDARLVVARQHVCPSWDALLAHAALAPPTEGWGWEHYEKPEGQATRAIRHSDLNALSELVSAHPTLISTPGNESGAAWSAIRSALSVERAAVTGISFSPSIRVLVTADGAARITDWLIARGADASDALNRMLLGEAFMSFRMMPAEVEFLLARGADPEWTAPNGFSVLEHALYRYRNGEAVDVLASRATPRDAFWIAAGLGHVRELRRYLDKHGRPTAAARRSRPDFTALAPSMTRIMPVLRDDDDLAIVWEAFLVAALNQRFAVMDALLATGFPVDYRAVGWSLLQWAVSTRKLPLVECLVARGADPTADYYGRSNAARTIAANYLRNWPHSDEMRRIYELCGGTDADSLIESARSEAKATAIGPDVTETLRQAAIEASLLRQSAVEGHNVFAAILRDDRVRPLALTILAVSGVDVARLRQLLADRLAPLAPDGPAPDLPQGDDVQRALAEALTEAGERRRGTVHPLNVLWGLAANETGVIADLLRATGSSPSRLRERLADV